MSLFAPKNEEQVRGREKARAPAVGGEENKVLSGNEIREMFLRFFEGKGHKRLRSSSLVPHGDPTLLFTNAGMNQFKDVFLGLEKRSYSRATTAQKCVRAGGKHNDLENVGFTKRHHTFFEMLGNFSFGDYFKKETIAYAWELVTSPEWFGIDKNKLYVTVFGGAQVSGNHLGVDEEAKGFWLEQRVPADRIVAIPGLKENFWAMGDTGPCGPCSEIHYDMGPAASDLGHGLTAPECKFPCDCGRFVEIWNLVFMQYNRDESGKLAPLPKPCVDTGMGLERTAAVLQGVISNYDTDLFVPLMERAAELCGVDFQQEEKLEEGKGGAASLRVIADHARATTFLMTDGVLPSNEGRGYVLRKIIRRAIRHGRLLGVSEPFLFKMASDVRGLMGDAYPELREAAFEHILVLLAAEETRFGRTLDAGLKMLDPLLRHPRLDGDVVFRIYDTYGLPRDFIEDAARDAQVAVDWEGFDRAMHEQRARARASWKGGAKEAANPAYAKLAETLRTEPGFYSGTAAKDCRIEAIISKSGPVKELKAGESGEVVLDRTVIYAESGGQVADTGAFYDNSGAQELAAVTGAFYPVAGLIAHRVVATETLRVGDRVAVVADAERRARIIRNHTGTHLVHAALRNILGIHVKQSGSLNAPDRLRFDFSHFAHVGAEELGDIEQQVNDEIRLNTQVETSVTSLEEALNSGALAFFGDKYPESNVRVVTIPDPRSPRGFYSKELCGGTHVERVGDIGVLKIVGEESVAAGVRRIEAVTGIGALEHYQRRAQTLRQLASQLNVGEDAVLAQVEKLSETVKQLEKDLEAQKRKGALGQLDELAARVQLIKGIKVIAEEVQNVDRDGLRQLVDSLRQKLGSGVVALGTPENGKVALIAGVTKDLTVKIHAGKLIGALAEKLGGKGGGRPDLAEAGGKDTAGLKRALQTVPSLIETWL
ncbi:MAG: alanine--tRNA ligase [Acidobacteria bacterium]|nr:MAG: alanine--tRNA ligase [Acidobacteriota bacterium]PYT86892.1 MAG: alanine--tRNA ligase [Acidobacteriota bacterium]